MEEGCLVGQGHALHGLAHLGAPFSTMAGKSLPDPKHLHELGSSMLLPQSQNRHSTVATPSCHPPAAPKLVAIQASLQQRRAMLPAT